MKNEIMDEIIKELKKDNWSENEIYDVVSLIKNIQKEESQYKFTLETIKNNHPNNFEKIKKVIIDNVFEDFLKNRKEECENIKNNEPKDSTKYIEFAIEKYIYRDLLLNDICFTILKTKENGIKFVEWLENENEEKNDILTIKKCLEIRLNDGDYVADETAKKDNSLIKLIEDKDPEKILTKDEIIYFISQLSDENMTRMYVYNKLSEIENNYTRNFKHFICDIINVPEFCRFDDYEKYEKDEEEKCEKEKYECLEKLNQYKDKGILNQSDVYYLCNALELGMHSKLLNLFNYAEENNLSLTEEDIKYQFVRIALGLEFDDYELLKCLGFDNKINYKSNQIRLARYINRMHTHIFVEQNYSYVISHMGYLQMSQTLPINTFLNPFEEIENTTFNIATSDFWNMYLTDEIKLKQVAYVSTNKDEVDEDSIIPIHILDDEVNKNCKKGSYFDAQISAIALEINKINSKEDEKIFYSNINPKINVLYPSKYSNVYKYNKDLCLINAKVKECNEIILHFYDDRKNVQEIIIDTQFGQLSIFYNDEEPISKGDIIEAALYISADAIIHLNDYKYEANLENNYELLRLAFQKHNFKIMQPIMRDDVKLELEYEGKTQGKAKVYKYFQSVLEEKFDRNFKGMLANITKKGAGEQIEVGDLVMVYNELEDDSIQGIFKIELDDENMIKKIILSKNTKTEFHII